MQTNKAIETALSVNKFDLIIMSDINNLKKKRSIVHFCDLSKVPTPNNPNYSRDKYNTNGDH